MINYDSLSDEAIIAYAKQRKEDFIGAALARLLEMQNDEIERQGKKVVQFRRQK